MGVAKRPKHLGAFRLGDYLPTAHAAYIRDYPLVNIVYLSAVATLYLHHIASVPLSAYWAQDIHALFRMTISGMHFAAPQQEIGGWTRTSNHICTRNWCGHKGTIYMRLMRLLTLSKDALVVFQHVEWWSTEFARYCRYLWDVTCRTPSQQCPVSSMFHNTII